MRHRLDTQPGFSLIEMLVVIVVIGILAAVAMQSMTTTVQNIRQVRTEREMEMLTKAIVGDPALTQNNQRGDFGYVGDVGAFPPNLQALYQNPGGYATWDGPYLASSYSQDNTGFKTDDWGAVYVYGGGATITSTGGGSALSKKIADATDDYLLNTINGTILDADHNPPGPVYADSIDIVITIPDGSGSTTSKTCHPNMAGAFSLDTVPCGNHLLRVIYTPDVDTLVRYLAVLPRHKGRVSYRFASAHFGGGGGSDTVWYVGYQQAKRSSDGNSVTISTPGGGSGQGDLLIAAVVTDGNKSGSLSPPGGEGWSEVDISQQTGAVTLGVWWKLAGASESPNHQFSWSGNGQEAFGGIMRFSGNDQTNPVHASATNGGSSSWPTCPSVTTTISSTMIVRIGGFDDDDITTDSTGLTGHTDITMDESSSGWGTCSGGAAYRQQAAAGASGTANFSLTSSEQYRTVTISIAPTQ